MSTLQERTRFEPAEVEPRIAERWIASGLHHPEPDGTPDENYSIAVPPPNVTGVLHMGPALTASAQDPPRRPGRVGAGPRPPQEGRADEVRPRPRPRRDRNAEAGREAAGGPGPEPRGG